MIQNEKQYILTRRQWSKFNEAILRLKRKQLVLTIDDDVNEYALKEVELAALESMRDDLQTQMDEYDRRVNSDRVGNWMTLYSGVRFWPQSPKVEDINIRDIAHALSCINRYGGHTYEPYSVAQHCVLGSRVIDQKYALPFLLHDAGECYLGDVITPIKRLFRDFYEPAEEKVMQAVAGKFGFSLDGAVKAEVKRIDMVMLATELRDLTPAGVSWQPLDELPLDEEIIDLWTPARAESAFMNRFTELVYERRADLRTAV